ncbi:uncharacterized protein C8Q71DRAFT_722455 [Rhodofomes roseus]|uniref:Uncharacterized protein n=1 Tax=Rhodofomes roseus TaxID=34475 RepID=A0ABQ8KNB6_9APHY|nr:uncharacterized protein C8Q71DRAFT_722455 [Rhodofomes roseus]KAH9839573.1 hypothetical protein C8Q71DRAFT_722455 [Rhodofomes roseus]
MWNKFELNRLKKTYLGYKWELLDTGGGIKPEEDVLNIKKLPSKSPVGMLNVEEGNMPEDHEPPEGSPKCDCLASLKLAQKTAELYEQDGTLNLQLHESQDGLEGGSQQVEYDMIVRELQDQLCHAQPKNYELRGCWSYVRAQIEQLKQIIPPAQLAKLEQPHLVMAFTREKWEEQIHHDVVIQAEVNDLGMGQVVQAGMVSMCKLDSIL